MTGKTRGLLLIAIMVGVGLAVAWLSIYVLYQMNLDRQKERLRDIVRNHARLIETIALHESKEDPPAEELLSATLDHFGKNPMTHLHFGETGRILAARLQEGKIVFLMGLDSEQAAKLPPIPLASGLAQPMARALEGKAGVMTGPDYRGVEVLAAYEPAQVFDIGLVAKMDMAEIRAPFFMGHWLIISGAGLIGLLGTLLVRGVSAPLIMGLERSLARLQETHKELRKTNRGLRVISGFNKKLVIAADEKILLQEACDMAVEVAGYRMAWVGFAEHDEKKTIRPAACAGFEEGYLEELDLTWADTERGKGPAGKAARTGQPAVVQDIRKDPHFLPWINEAAKRGYASAACLPLIAEADVLGVLCVYSPEPDFFTPDELNILMELASDLAFGIKTLRAGQAQRRWENALRENEERLRSILDNAPAVIFIKDLQGRYLLVNRQFEARTRFLGEVVLGKTDYELYPPDMAEALNANDRKVLVTGKPLEFEETIRAENGVAVFLSVKFPLRDPAGNPHALCGIATDITDRKNTEEQLLKLSRAVEQSPASIVITDIEGAIEYVNPKFTEVTGYASGEVVGKNPRILKSGHTPREEYEKIWSAILKGGEWQGEFHNKKKSGELYWEWANICPIKNKDGVITHFIAIKEDITGRKRAEQQLQQARKQLLGSEKLAAVGELAAGVCHEILNPLNIISIHVQMLAKKRAGDADLAEALGKVRKEIDRSRKIVEALMKFARKGDSKLVQVALPAELESVLALVEKDFNLDNIQVVRDIDPQLPQVRVDPDEMRQVFLNIVNNAKHAMRKGGGTLTLSAQKAPMDGGDCVRIKFSDTGTGIKKENLSKIFDPFFTTKPEGEGTGLGLAVVHTLVEKNGGAIMVESEEGKGAAFIVDLPV